MIKLANETNGKRFANSIDVSEWNSFNIMYVDGDGDGLMCAYIGDAPIKVQRYEHKATPPEVEYRAMHMGIKEIKNYDKWLVLSDNKLVVGQLALNWKINKNKFRYIKQKIESIISSRNLDITVGWIRGSENKASQYLKSSYLKNSLYSRQLRYKKEVQDWLAGPEPS